MDKPGKRAKAPVLRLVQSVKSAGAINCAHYLLHEAVSGDAVGFAYVAIRRGGAYSVGVAGTPRQCALAATLARGALKVLDEDLGKFVRG